MFSLKLQAKEASDHKVRFVTEIMSPFQFKQQGQLTGFAVELIEEVVNRTDLNAKIEVYPWARAYNIALTTPNVFIFTLVKTQERADKFIWIDDYYVATDSFYALNSRDDIVINSIADAKNYITCIPRNDVGEQRLVKLGFGNEHLKKVAFQAQCLGMLYRDRVDLNLFNELGIRALAKKFDMERNAFKRMFVVSKAVMGVAASKDSNPAAVNAVRIALKEIKSQPSFANRMERWFGAQ